MFNGMNLVWQIPLQKMSDMSISNSCFLYILAVIKHSN